MQFHESARLYELGFDNQAYNYSHRQGFRRECDGLFRGQGDCTLILMSEWETKLPGYLAPKPAAVLS